ncbi:MAG: thymidine phosphorylase [Planctomycetota bacterium]|jgi:thymidine phosphorylase
MIDRWLAERAAGTEQRQEDVEGFIRGVVDGSLGQAQVGAWLAFVYLKGMTARETVWLTAAMTASGDRLAWPGLDGPFVDKHSTGGIGDKVSLVLAPVWAALGRRVPMLSGRGLGITGGTLDKLESIPGYRTDLPMPALRPVLEDVGCFINGQTAELAPADRILYRTRDETGTVASVPLITASILSKKLVEGLDLLVMDVKHGSGAFMPTRAEAKVLATSLREVGEGAGVSMEVHLTDMNTPLGRTVGNALEVEEAEACLQGQGPTDLEDLVVQLSGAGEEARATLHDGRALVRWQAMVRAHGGDPEATRHGADVVRLELPSPHAGTVTACDAGAIGRAAFALGAGRRRASEDVHFGVGLRLLAKPGESVAAGDPLVELWHAAEHGLDAARAEVEAAYRIE